MVKKLMDTATKAGIDAAKTASNRVVQKTAEATGNAERKQWHLKIMHHLSVAFQKLMVYKLTMQKT